MSSGSLGFSNISSRTFLAILELIVPLSIKITKFASSFAVNGISTGSISFSFKILEISEIIQLLTALWLPQILLASSNKFDKYLEETIIPASFSDILYSFLYLSYLLSGNSGKFFFTFSIYSSDNLIATKSGSGKYL